MARTPRVNDVDLLKQIVLYPDPVVTAAELSEHVDYSPDGVRRRLHDLEGKGFVKSRKVGANAVVWWPTEAGRRQL